MDKALKKEDHRNCIKNLARDIAVNLKFDGERLCISPVDLAQIRNNSLYEDRDRNGSVLVILTWQMF